MWVQYLGHMLILYLCFRSDLSAGMQEWGQLCGSWNLQLSRRMDRRSLPHRWVTTPRSTDSYMHKQDSSTALEFDFCRAVTICCCMCVNPQAYSKLTKWSQWYLLCLSAAVCKKRCMNGGKCVSPNTCRCRAPFSGPQCEERKKLYWCQNSLTSDPIAPSNWC